MNTTNYPFSVRYAGPATKSNLIDVRDLATSLVGLNSALDFISREGFSAGMHSKLEVNARFREGSAIADLVLTLSPYATTGAFVLSQILPEAREAIALLTDVIKLFKIFSGNKIPDDAITSTKEGAIRVSFENCTFTTSGGAIHLYSTGSLQKPLQQAFSPIVTDKINEIELLSNLGEQLTTVTSKDVGSFEPRENTAAPEINNYYRVTVVIRQPSLDGDKKWALSWDGTNFAAKIEDPNFLGKVAARMYTFGHGDQLLVDLQMVVDPGKKPFWIVKTVHDLIQPQIQYNLF